MQRGSVVQGSMNAVAALLVVAVLVVGCGNGGSGDVAGDVVVGGSELVPPTTRPTDVPAGPTGLARCEDVPELRSQLEGELSGRRNPDHIVEGVLATYAMEHPDTFGGRWIDRASGGVLVLGFTDDPEPHRAAILERRPTADDYPVVDPPPPITDDRPLGERDDVVIDVVQVRFSEAEVEVIRDRMWRSISREDWRSFGLDGTGYDIKRQRVSLYLVNPPEGALAEIAERIPDPSAVCVEVTRTPQPPEGPLAVIPDLNEEDPLVSCPGTPPVRYSQMIDPPSIDDVDHPAVDVLRAELRDPGDEPLPRGRWVVISIDSDRATFAALSEGGFGVGGHRATRRPVDLRRRGIRATLRADHSAAGRARLQSRCASTPTRCPTRATPASMCWSPSRDAPAGARCARRCGVPR